LQSVETEVFKFTGEMEFFSFVLSIRGGIGQDAERVEWENKSFSLWKYLQKFCCCKKSALLCRRNCNALASGLIGGGQVAPKNDLNWNTMLKICLPESKSWVRRNCCCCCWDVRLEKSGE
jgi:hypothetical protein